MIKYLGVFIVLFLVAGGIESGNYSFIPLALPFLMLTLGAFAKVKYTYIFVGLFSSSVVINNLFSGEAMMFAVRAAHGRHHNAMGYTSLAEDPSAYWLHILLNTLFSLSLLAYGIYEGFYKKDPAPSEDPQKVTNLLDVPLTQEIKEKTDELFGESIRQSTKRDLNDIERVSTLLDVPSTQEFKEKADQLFVDWDAEYKDDESGKARIEILKSHIINKEIDRRMRKAEGG